MAEMLQGIQEDFLPPVLVGRFWLSKCFSPSDPVE